MTSTPTPVQIHGWETIAAFRMSSSERREPKTSVSGRKAKPGTIFGTLTASVLAARHEAALRTSIATERVSRWGTLPSRSSAKASELRPP
jgi:hypothetical protein